MLTAAKAGKRDSGDEQPGSKPHMANATERRASISPFYAGQAGPNWGAVEARKTAPLRRGSHPLPGPVLNRDQEQAAGGRWGRLSRAAGSRSDLSRASSRLPFPAPGASHEVRTMCLRNPLRSPCR